jgi:site-specific DNA-methyltransferase (adenine-specific)
MESENCVIYNKSCYGLGELGAGSVDALITDPPYGISFLNNYWDRDLPQKEIWAACFRVMKSGAFGMVFSSVWLLHRLMVQLEDTGFLIKDILFWVYLNGMPKNRNIAVDIDKELGVESEIIGTYNYVQGYRKDKDTSYYANEKYKKAPASTLGKRYAGCGLALKPAYEPIILVQKPVEAGLTVAQNVVKYGVGVLNLEAARIPYAEGEAGVGHNPHPEGRLAANIIRTEEFGDDYDKFFVVPKVRQHAEEFNKHPTLKPLELMEHLVRLASFEGQLVLDPFTGSGTTGLACLRNGRAFVGYELDSEYYEICTRRLAGAVGDLAERLL